MEKVNFTIRNMQETDASGVMNIYNYFAENDFSAYFDRSLPIERFDRFLEMARNYPAFVACDEHQEVIGFAFLHAYHSAPAFQRTAEVTHFLHHQHVGKGLGTLMLNKLIAEAIEIGVDNILASISSQNVRSLAFHTKHGFREYGRLPSIGRKFGQDFDIVYMQLTLLQNIKTTEPVLHFLSKSGVWHSISEFVDAQGVVSRATGMSTIEVSTEGITNRNYAELDGKRLCNDYEIRVVSPDEFHYRSANPALGIQQGTFHVRGARLYSNFVITDTALHGFEIIRCEGNTCFADGALYDGDRLINTWTAMLKNNAK